jgi:hypothetical protein
MPPLDRLDDLDLNHPPAASPPAPNDDAVRLWLIDQTLQHLTRQQGVLGLGANAVSQSLRAEREEIVGRLQALGPRFDEEPPRRRA